MKRPHLEELREIYKDFTREELNADIEVTNEFNNQASETLSGWFAVVTQIGIIAYFGDMEEAYAYKSKLMDGIIQDRINITWTIYDVFSSYEEVKDYKEVTKPTLTKNEAYNVLKALKEEHLDDDLIISLEEIRDYLEKHYGK